VLSAHPGGDVPRRDAASFALANGSEVTRQHDAFPRQAGAKTSGGPPPGPDLDALALEPNIYPQRSGHVGGIGYQGDRRRHRPRFGRPEPGPGAGGQTGGGEGYSQAEEGGLAGGQGAQDDQGGQPGGQRAGGEGAGGGAEGHQDSGKLAHAGMPGHTFTSGRRASILVGPIPGTSSSSVTDRNRP
jgi:hypothetical protein